MYHPDIVAKYLDAFLKVRTGIALSTSCSAVCAPILSVRLSASLRAPQRHGVAADGRGTKEATKDRLLADPHSTGSW